MSVSIQQKEPSISKFSDQVDTKVKSLTSLILRRALTEILASREDPSYLTEVASKLYEYGAFFHYLTFFILANETSKMDARERNELQTKLDKKARKDAQEEMKRLVQELLGVDPG